MKPLSVACQAGIDALNTAGVEDAAMVFGACRVSVGGETEELDK